MQSGKKMGSMPGKLKNLQVRTGNNTAKKLPGGLHSEDWQGTKGRILPEFRHT